MSKSLRYGIIGCAGIGNTHAEAVKKTDRAELVACADLDPEAASEFADSHDVSETYEDITAMITQSDVDAVSVCTPSGTHSQVIVEAAEAGANILCEKPLDVFADRMDRAIDACDAAGVKLAGVYQKRFNAANQRAKEAIESGELGEPILGDTRLKWFRPQSYYDSGGWRGTRDMDGGVLMNQAIHQIDLLAWLMGGISEVTAITDRLSRDLECEDTAAFAVRFKSGALGTIEGTTAVKGGKTTTELNGTEGSITIDGSGISHFAVGTGEESRWHAETEQIEVDLDEQEWGTHHQLVIEDFVGAILDDREPSVPGHEARHAVDVILAAYASNVRGETVAVADVRDGIITGPEVRTGNE